MTNPLLRAWNHGATGIVLLCMFVAFVWLVESYAPKHQTELYEQCLEERLYWDGGGDRIPLLIEKSVAVRCYNEYPKR